MRGTGRGLGALRYLLLGRGDRVSSGLLIRGHTGRGRPFDPAIPSRL